MNKPETPDSIKAHDADYTPDAWMDYTEEELLWWVRLLRKRAGMRTVKEKALKDRADADNYEKMLQAKRGAS